MMKGKVVLFVIFALVVTSMLPSVAWAQGGEGRFRPGDATIAEIAVANGNFTTLVQALTCTGLVDAVANPDAELTVFAPDDAAFAKANLNAGNICDVFDTDQLTTILLYHVTDGRRPSPSVIMGRNKSIEMLAGGAIYPEGKGSLTIDASNSSANIVVPDILASNGIIHVIDFVLLP